MSFKKVMLTLVKLGVLAGIVYYLLLSGKLDLTKTGILWQHPWTMAAVTLVVLGFTNILICYRGFLLLRVKHSSLSLFRLYFIHWISLFFAIALPGSLSGDGVKAYYIIKESDQALKKTDIFTALIVDRFMGLFSIILIFFMVSALNLDIYRADPSLWPMGLIASAVALGMTLFFIIVTLPFNPERDLLGRLLALIPRGGLLVHLYVAFRAYHNHRFSLLICLLISLVTQSSIIGAFYLITPLVAEQTAGVMELAFAVPLSELSTAIPLGPNGLGVGHIAFDYMYNLVHLKGGADAFNLFLIIRMSISLLGGIPYLLYRRRDGAPEV